MALFKQIEDEEKPVKKAVTPEGKILKRKNKEPPKPWGKKERIIIFLVLFLTVFISLLLGFSAREWKLPGLPRLGFSNISLLKEKTITFENTNKTSYPAEWKDKSEKAVSEFGDLTKDLSGVYGLFVLDLKSGFKFGVARSEKFQAASLIKLPVMAAMFKASELGKLDLDSLYTLRNSDKISGAGSLSSKPAGTKIKYLELLELMGQQSDNTAYGIARRIVGDEAVDKIISDAGMSSTSLEENSTSPEDIGIFFEKLWLGKIISSKNSQKFLDYLTDTAYENWLKQGLPEDIRLAHKFGREVHVVNDAGIVFSDRPFIMVILSKGVVEREADQIFPKLAETVYQSWAN